MELLYWCLCATCDRFCFFSSSFHRGINFGSQSVKCDQNSVHTSSCSVYQSWPIQSQARSWTSSSSWTMTTNLWKYLSKASSFDILKKALFSSQDQSRAVANELDSLLSTYLTCEQDQSQHRPNLYGFIAELVLIISQTAMQIPIQHEELHQKLAKVIIELSQLDTVYEYEGRETSWHQLPFVEAEFEDQSHREFQRRENDFVSFAWSYMLRLKTSCSDE